MFKSKYLTILTLLLFVTLSGCASIVGKGAPQVIPINSNPTDAKLKIENLRTGTVMYEGKTPYTATLERSAGYFKSARYNITVQKDGYQAKQFILDGSVNGWYLGGNLIFGGLIGYLIVDPLTGAMWTLSPEEVRLDLSQNATSFDDSKGLMIVLKSELPENLIAKLKPVDMQK